MNDIIAQKRSSLRVGMIKVNMFQKINKHLLNSDVYEVVKIDLQWQYFISERPTMPEYNNNDENNDDIKANEKKTRLNIHIS